MICCPHGIKFLKICWDLVLGHVLIFCTPLLWSLPNGILHGKEFPFEVVSVLFTPVSAQFYSNGDGDSSDDDTHVAEMIMMMTMTRKR